MIEQGTITAADADRLFDSLERETTTMSCPYCAEEIRVEAAKCKHCNQFLAQTHPTGSRIMESDLVVLSLDRPGRPTGSTSAWRPRTLPN